MKNSNIAIIGATGKTGVRVARTLNTLGHSPRTLSRPAFDWNQPQNWSEALNGVRSVYITYQPDLAIPRAARDIEQLVAIAKRAGVEHLVLLSGRGEQGAQQAEEQIRHSGLAWNVVRASWFMQNFSESFMLDGIQARHMVLPEVQAKEPFIDADDITDIVTAALTREELRNQLFEVTGPELLTFSECTQLIAAALNEPIRYQSVPLQDYLSFAKQGGMPDDLVWLMRELFAEVLDGRNESVTTTVETVLGRPPRRFQDYVSAAASTDIWNQQPYGQVS